MLCCIGKTVLSFNLKHICVCSWQQKKARCSVELGVFVFVDLVPKYMQTVCVCRTLGGCSEVAVATSNKASQCLEVGESRRQGESGRKRKGQIRGEVGCGLLFFSCGLQSQNPQLNSHNLHRWKRLIWYLFHTFQLHDLMTQCARHCCTAMYSAM